MQETHSAAAVANTFLELARREGHSLTNMQVQKLAFMSHGVHLAAFDSPLIHECPRAWTFGPVIPTLYESLRRYGSNTVTGMLEATDQVVANSSAEKAINATWDAYKGWTGAQLSKLSHVKGGPWDRVWNAPDGKGKFGYIPDAIIKDYYLARVSLQPKAAVAC